jgi:hypothetical protein
MHFGSHHRAWIDPLPLQLDLIHHEAPHNIANSMSLGPAGDAGTGSVTLGAIAGDAHRVGFSDEPGP